MDRYRAQAVDLSSGSLIMASLENGMILMNMDVSWRYVGRAAGRRRLRPRDAGMTARRSPCREW
jgi:hypothetical protein